MKNFTRRFVVAAAAAVVGTMSMIGVGQAQDDKTIRIGLQPAPLIGYIVKEKQLLEKRGYKPEWSVFPFSPPIIEGMAAGSIDVALLGLGPVLSVAQRDAGIWYIYDELANAAQFIVQADSGINGPQDLKGKKVAFPGKSSQLYAQLMIYLAGSGVTENDMELVRVNASDMNTLFDRKEVDAALAWPPFTSEPLRTGKAKMLFTADDLFKGKGDHWLNSGWGARKDFAEKNPAAVIALVESLHEATRFMREQPEEAYKILSAASGYSLEATSYMLEQKLSTHYDPEITAPSADDIIKIFDILVKNNVVKDEGGAEAKIRSIVHPEFVEQVLGKK
ncbi:MAG: ABC transporter substrate-binding protein [Mesorhizobium sp.]